MSHPPDPAPCLRNLCIWLLLTVLTPAAMGAELISALTLGSAPVNAPNITGGNLTDLVTGVALDAEGNIYIAGLTFSPTFPARTPILAGIPEPTRYMFVAKLSPDASRLFWVRLFDNAYASAIRVDAAGNAYVAGWTQGWVTLPGVPVSLEAGAVPASSQNAFVLKFDPAGAGVQYAVYIAGARANGIALDAAGNAYVAGFTSNASGFPSTAGAFQTSQECKPPFPGRSCQAAFAAKINASGTALVYATLLSGSYGDYAAGVAVDASGAAYIAGTAESADFPVTPGAVQPRHAGSETGSDAFVAKLNPAGSALVYSTYLGGAARDSANGIALGPDGSAYITGATDSDDFPVTPQAYQTGKRAGAGSAFVARLDSAGQSLIYSTLFGAASGKAIAVDARGVAHITGATSDGLPVFRAFQPSFYPALLYTYTPSGITPIGTRLAGDAFAAALNEDGSGLVYSTYLSSPADDAGLAVALSPKGEVLVAGSGPLSLAARNPLSTGGGAFLVRFRAGGTPPFFTRESITNGASFASGLVQPGGIASIFCANLTGIDGVLTAPRFPLTTELARVRVSINGVPAPLFAVMAAGGQQQINLQVPFEASADAAPLDVEVSQDGVSAWVAGVPTRSTAPGLFTIDGTYGAIQHASDYALVTPENAARPGEAIVLYGTGLGWVAPLVASGWPAPGAPIAHTTQSPWVTIGGEPATVLFSGLAPGGVGLYQINALVPAGIPAGDRDVVVSFPPYTECCIGGLIDPRTVRVDSTPVKIAIR